VAVHVVQPLLVALLAIAAWLLLDGLRNRPALVARIALPIFLVYFSAYDAVAGIASGALQRHTDQTAGPTSDAFSHAAHWLFYDSVWGRDLGMLALTQGAAWIVLVLATALALRRAGARTLTVVLMVLSAPFASHGGPTGVLAMLAFFGAALTWDSQTAAGRERRCDQPHKA
jgi:hypothetical protein